MSAPPSSLRDLYATPSTSWAFLPPLSSNADSNSTYASGAGQSYQWSTRTRENPFFDLSSTLHDDHGHLNPLLSAKVKALLVSAFFQYATTAIIMPLDVGKLLLQVQWVPKDAGEVVPGAALTTDAVDDEEELSDSSDDKDAYFADPSDPNTSTDSAPPLPRLADERGYVVRQSVLEEGTIPEYIIPVGSADGAWGMAQCVGRFKAEGWMSLWKGLLTSAINDALSASIQPIIHSFLQSLLSPVLPPPTPFSPSPMPLLLPVISHVATGFLLSPLDLVRTRLIIQSAHPRHRTYSGPIDALRQILAHEGGLRGVYLHPHLLLPALLDCTLRALVPLTLPGLAASYLGFGVPLSPETHPLLWAGAELLGGCAGLLVTLPAETVRRRLQAQPRGTARPLRACVELRPRPYNGVVDALWHIITEERSDLPLERRRRRRRKSSSAKGKAPLAEGQGEEGEGWLRSTGIGQLYRGLGMRASASLVMFVLAVLGGDEQDSGWAEL